MRRLASALFALLLVLNLVTGAHAVSTWTLKTDSVNLNLKGVSPYVEKLPSGDDRLYFPGPNALPDNIMVTDCNEAGNCTRQKISSPFGSDPTIVTLKDGTRKVFFVETSPQSRTIKYATLGADGLSHGTVSELGVEGSSVTDKRGWGVPDAVVMPDGRVKVFWVTMDLNSPSNPPEYIISATSTDATATKFVRDSGTRIKGYVDTKILQAKPGDWIMICATGPSNGIQKLFMARSPNGSDWNVDPNPITSNAESAFDPTGYQINSDTWRIYYVSAAPGNGLGNDNTIKRATLTKTDTPGAGQSPSPNSSPITNNQIQPIATLSKQWLLKQDDINLPLTGVSPHVVKLSTGEDRLYFVTPKALPDDIMIMDCTDSGSCKRQTLGSKFGTDVTTVTLKDGTQKIFYVEMAGQNRSIKYANLSADGLSVGASSDLGVQDASISDKRGWGVPDSVVMPDGRVKVYWVTMDFPPTRMPPEDVVSATSTDATATKFVRDSGYVLRGGYASTKILQAKPGNWVMILCTASTYAQLFIATSPDGNQWTLDPNPISGTNESAFDPTGYQLSDNTWRIYYASTPAGQEIGSNTTIKRATLTKVVTSSSTVTASPTPSATTAKASPTPTPKVTSTTITCVKGKLTKKVSGVNPKCPTGYTKK